MDKELDSRMTSRKIDPPKWPHLKPLSDYSRRVACDQKSSPYQPGKFSNPFINLKFEVVDNCTSKRKMDDSSVDDGYETPAKKAFTTTTSSPDLGCFMDYCSPLTRQESVSPFSTSSPALLPKKQGIKNAMKENVSPQLHPEHVERGSSADPRGKEETVSCSVQNQRLLLNLGRVFDNDVDGIFSLTPSDTSNAARFSSNVESCRSPPCNLHQNVAHRQVDEKGDGQVQEGREPLQKDTCLDVEEDKGYLSVSSINEHKIGVNTPDSAHPLLPSTTSSPLLRTSKAELAQDTIHPKSSSEPLCHEQAAMRGQSTVDDLCSSVSGPLLEPLILPVECLQGEEEMLHIGPPIFESSVCDSDPVKLNATSEQNGQGSEETKENVKDSVHNYQDTTLDGSSSTSLPLQVQVKSKVVIPTTSSIPVPPLPPGENTKLKESNQNKDRTVPTAKHGKNQRAVVLNRQVDWEYKKNQYVHSVTQHLTENPGANHGVMSELLSLMSHVADQTTGSNGTQWQHPSDLTRRNYQRRFGNAAPSMTLHDWKAKNSPTQKRFAKVPKIFARTPFP